MKSMYLNTFFTTLLLVVLGFSLFAQNQSYALETRFKTEGVLFDMENPIINYTHAEYDKINRQVIYHGFIGTEIIYETVAGDQSIPLNTFSLVIEDHPHANAITVDVTTAKGYHAFLEVRDYQDGFLGYKIFADEIKVGEAQADLNYMVEFIKIEVEIPYLVKSNDAFNLLRYSPVEFAAISPFKLFAPQHSFSNGTLDLASPIELMETKFLKWLGKDRGLGLYFDKQLVTSYSNVCVISSEDGVTENCHENFDETKEGDSYVKVIFID
ncbi:MAG: hypothetical protein VXY37_03310 [Bacteroidota bacterium]|nr:hypothetical protein [Bacteroidota bacterium]